MNELVPLLMLWALSKGSASSPAWPTTASPPPPPPMPPLPGPPPPTTADTGTPLADLHAAPPAASVPKTVKKKVTAKVKKAIKDIPAHVLQAAIKNRGVVMSRPGVTDVPAPPQSDVSVANIQTALIKRGAKIVKDGLYGPKTAAAWQTMARKYKLSPIIYRRTGKIARVATQTYNTLQGPVIP